MENLSLKLKAQSKRNLPPKRGQIKLRIIKSLISSVASIGGSSKRRRRGIAEPIASPAPASTPSVYSTDAHSVCPGFLGFCLKYCDFGI